MDHKPYIKETDNKKCAVLMLHGILSTPRHFDFLLSAIPDDVSVYNILLDGHGGSVKDFSKTNMKKWKQQVDETLTDLCSRYEKVVVVGFSMGTLLAIDAQKNHRNISSLLLLNCPLKIFVRPKMNIWSLRICFGMEDKNNVHMMKCKDDTSIKLTRKMWKYIAWIPNGLSLLTLSKDCRKIANDIDVPCKAYFGQKDELVSVKSADYLRDNKNAEITIFDSAGHFYIEDKDKEKIKNSLCEVINNA